MKNCARCGAPMENDTGFCSQCGSPVLKTQTTRVVTGGPSIGGSGGKKKVVIAAILVLLLIGAGYVWFGGLGSGASLEQKLEQAGDYLSGH